MKELAGLEEVSKPPECQVIVTRSLESVFRDVKPECALKRRLGSLQFALDEGVVRSGVCVQEVVNGEILDGVDWDDIVKKGVTNTNYQILPGDRIYVKADPLITADTLIAKVTSPVERILGPGISPDSMRSRMRRVFSQGDAVSNTLVKPYRVSMSWSWRASSGAGIFAASAHFRSMK